MYDAHSTEDALQMLEEITARALMHLNPPFKAAYEGSGDWGIYDGDDNRIASVAGNWAQEAGGGLEGGLAKLIALLLNDLFEPLPPSPIP